ncbi:hypothetical protein ACFQT0_13530 [Hymenobacter humi]|uniref:Isochorismate synthase n=1 Tax=Hymenobacter humi TaxID=1411620 RepID=A0ABW2U757_9BACT
MNTSNFRQLRWPAVATGLDAAARLRHVAAGALRTNRPLAVWREPGAPPRLLVARSLEAAYTGLPPALDAQAPAGFAFFLSATPTTTRRCFCPPTCSTTPPSPMSWPFRPWPATWCQPSRPGWPPRQ